MIGLPPTAGFISKWYMLSGAFQEQQVIAILVIIISTLLNAAYFLPVIYVAWFKSPDAPGGFHEAPRPIVLALMITASLTLLLFFFPDIPLQLGMRLTGE